MKRALVDGLDHVPVGGAPDPGGRELESHRGDAGGDPIHQDSAAEHPALLDRPEAHTAGPAAATAARNRASSATPS